VLSERFKDIGLADSSMDGVLFARERIYIYDCCGKCFKKIDTSLTSCMHCSAPVSGTHDLKSFNLTLLVANPDLGDVIRVQLIMSHLDMERGKWTVDEVQNRLEKQHMRHITVLYDKDNLKGLNVRVEAVKFEAAANDSGL
jgi:hypothetical protein